MSARTDFRVFGKYNGQRLFTPDTSSGRAEEPRISTIRSGFRVDSELTRQDNLTVEGDIYSGTIGRFFLQEGLTMTRDGADLLTRWTHRLNNGSETTLQVYWDRSNRTVYDASFLRNTIDVDFQHEFSLAERHNIVWGIRADYTYDRSMNSVTSGFDPSRLGFKIFDAFVQDEIPLAGNRFQLVAGSKIEHNDYTGFEWQPNIRFAWTPDERQTVWTAVSRGVVVPSRSYRAGYLNLPPTANQPGNLPVAIAYKGNPAFTSQSLLAYEAGYRNAIQQNLSVDLAVFYNNYRHLSAVEAGVPYLGDGPAPYLVVPFVPGNRMRGASYGLELSANWKPVDRWKVTGSYSRLDMHLHLLPGSNAFTSADDQKQSPRHQMQIHSYLDLPHRFELDAACYFSSARPTWNISPHARADIRLGRRFGEHAEISVVGQNLLAYKQLESIAESELPPTSIRRSFFGQMLWRF